MPIGQEAGVTSSGCDFSISFQQVERVAALAVEFVDEGQDRHVAQPADLEEVARLPLDAPRWLWRRASSTITTLSTPVRSERTCRRSLCSLPIFI
jgi:hypothetical protein